MSSANRRTTLSEQIAEILATRAQAAGITGTRDTGNVAAPRLAMRKSIACGSIMMLAINPAPVGAVGLGEIHVQSRLGQPLEATVALSLREGESLPKNCVQPAPANNTLGAPKNMQVTSPAHNGPGVYNVRISTANPLHEPMYELSLMVKCPGTALLVRQYVLMLDLPGMPVAATTPAPVTSTVNATARAPRVSSTRSVVPVTRQTRGNASRALSPRTDGIAAGSQYRVANGDTLSAIARRVKGRLANTTWNVADQIFADNPNAFIRNDPNLIKLGSLIRVPEATVLAAMAPQSRRSTRPATSTRAPVTIARAAPVRDAVPTRAPIRISSREVIAARNSQKASATPASVRWPVPGSPEADAVTKSMEVAPTVAPVVTTTGNVANEAAPSSYPFVDELPTEPVVNTAVEPAPITAATTNTPQEPEQSNSLLSILFGLLLGAALSVVALRGRVMTALGVRRKTRPVATVAGQPQHAANQTNTFDASMAAAAFDATSRDVNGLSSLPISGPVEDTYIVETGLAADPTIREDISDLRTDSDTAEQPQATAPIDSTDALDAVDTSGVDDNSAELAQLFENDHGTAEATAGTYSPTMNEPTVEMPHGNDIPLEVTAEVPQQVEGDFFDPTAELPASALDEIFDPTGGVDGGETNQGDSTLMQAFDADLENFDPNEIFANGNQGIDDLTVEVDTDLLDSTLNAPVVEDPTVESELEYLPSDDDEDGNLSETLHEALALLERDFEEEFTASQILERSALEKSLKDDLEQEEAERSNDDVQRKIS